MIINGHIIADSSIVGISPLHEVSTTLAHFAAASLHFVVYTQYRDIYIKLESAEEPFDFNRMAFAMSDSEKNELAFREMYRNTFDKVARLLDEEEYLEQANRLHE